MKKKMIAGAIVFFFVVSLSGCSTIEENPGAAVGAGLGATAGVLLGGDTEGMIVGGLVGALVGGAIGHYAYDRNRTRKQTTETYNYQPTQGYVLTIERAQVTPAVVYPGDTVDIQITYAVLTPSAGTQTTLKEIREITHNGKVVGRPEISVTRTSGTFTSTIPLNLPANADRGVYDVRTVVQSNNAQDVRHTQFTVQ